MQAVVLPSTTIGPASYQHRLSFVQYNYLAEDYYGLQNFGINYGLVFTAWGVGGFMLALLAGKVYDASASFDFAYYCSAIMLVIASFVALAVKPPRQIASRSRRQSLRVPPASRSIHPASRRIHPGSG